MTKKICIAIIIFSMIFSLVLPSSFALELSEASLVKIGTADYHLKYYNESKGMSTYVICSIVGYNNDGKFYPAYCMNRDLPGAETTEYTVNISEILANDAVWRVVTNGYPYKTPEEMGLGSFDAFAVTKLAIYCVLGQSDLSKYSYDNGDEIGKKMYETLCSLVDIGLNGTNTRENGTITVNKIGDLTEADNGYYQEYQVQSSIDMESFQISEISNFPSGTKTVNTQNVEQTVYNAGENFRIMIPESGMTSDINGNITIDSKVKNYPVFYGEAPSGYQNYVISYDSYGEESININFQKTTNTGVLKVIKIDSDTSTPICNVEFELQNVEDNSKKYVGTTNANGELYFTDLYPGTYVLKETKTGEKYNLNDNDFNITIDYNKQTDITVENDIKRGKIKVVKNDVDTKDSLKDVTFQILDADTREVIEDIKTNEEGIAYSSDLRIDKNYILVENWKNEYYIENTAEYQFNVKADEVVEIDVSNEKIKGQLKIIKVDKDDESVKIQGAKFELYDSNMNYLETIETDENGEAVSKEYPSVNQKYYLKEIEVPEEYNLDEEIKEITLNDMEITEIKICNELKKGNIKIVKKDANNAFIRLSGVKFELYDSDMNLLEELETDENGEAKSQMYPSVNRKYYLKEVSTLSEYVLDESLKECILVDNGELEVIINNSKKETTPTEKIVETVITERVEERVEEKVIEKIMEKPVIIENVKVLPRTGM